MLGKTFAKNIVYFDLETQKTAGDVGGWDRKDRMLMSVGVAFSTGGGEYRIFSEGRVQELIGELQRADLVVGFNVLNFDYGVLQGYTVMDLRFALPTLDLLADIEPRIGHRISLEALAQGTLGIGKTGGGLDAIRWFREGKLLEIAEYCCFDVKVTRMVHEYGIGHGEVFFHDRFGKKQRVAVDWKA